MGSKQSGLCGPVHGIQHNLFGCPASETIKNGVLQNKDPTHGYAHQPQVMQISNGIDQQTLFTKTTG